MFLADENEEKSNELSAEELETLESAAVGIRMAARIVDTPCNEMNVDHFLEVNYFLKFNFLYFFRQ